MTASITAVGALGLNSMVNESELLINVVKANKPKMLTGLDQKVSGQVQGYPVSLVADEEPPANRQDLTHSGTHVKRGKPAIFPIG